KVRNDQCNMEKVGSQSPSLRQIQSFPYRKDINPLLLLLGGQQLPTTHLSHHKNPMICLSSCGQLMKPCALSPRDLGRISGDMMRVGAIIALSAALSGCTGLNYV